MLLAEDSDVVDRLRRPLSTEEQELVDTVLEEASIIVEAYLQTRGIAPYEAAEDIPPIVTLVVSRMAARALTSNPLIPETTGSLQAGPFQAQLSEAYSTAVYLSRRDKELLVGVTGSMMSVSFISERGGYEVSDD